MGSIYHAGVNIIVSFAPNFIDRNKLLFGDTLVFTIASSTLRNSGFANLSDEKVLVFCIHNKLKL